MPHYYMGFVFISQWKYRKLFDYSSIFTFSNVLFFNTFAYDRRKKICLFTTYAHILKSYAQLCITWQIFTYIDIFLVHNMWIFLWMKISLTNCAQLCTWHNFLCTIHCYENLCKTKKRPIYQYNLMCITMWISCAQFFSSSIYALFPL